MISIISSSTRRRFEEAVETAQRVPGLEGELTEQREKSGEFERRDADREQLLEARGRTIEDLGAQLAALRKAAGHLAARVAAAPSQAEAGYRAAQILAAHADQFGLSGTDEILVVLNALRDLTQLRRVTLVYNYSFLKSAHATEEAAREWANQHGAYEDGWGHSTKHATRQLVADTLATSTWSTATLDVDAAAPWTTPSGPLTAVYIMESCGLPYAAFTDKAAAILAQGRANPSSTRLVRVELESDEDPLTVPQQRVHQ
ncbi:hypothetical protein [Streptomyces lincolnensis]|uniref:hypothetical protein n=1 Tax=Streptomyces lincolnensis TaxID=1915 RepID=UPI0037CD9EEB